MDDLYRKQIDELIILLQNLKSPSVTLLNMKNQWIWTEYALIAETNSAAHARGLYKNIGDFIEEHHWTFRDKRNRIPDENWILVDCGDLIIHLQSREARDFYDLEGLWEHGVPEPLPERPALPASSADRDPDEEDEFTREP